MECVCTNCFVETNIHHHLSNLSCANVSPVSLFCLRQPVQSCVLFSSSNLQGELWRLEDDMDCDDEPEHGGCTHARPRSQSPFSHFRARAAYLRKSVSADDHLDMGVDESSGTAGEGKPSRGSKGKLKRKFVSTIVQPHSRLWFGQKCCVGGS